MLFLFVLPHKVSVPEEKYRILDNLNPICPEGSPEGTIPQIQSNPNDTVYLLTDGSLHSVKYSKFSQPYQSPQYCLDKIQLGPSLEDIQDIALLCFPPQPTFTFNYVLGGCLIASCVFLALTLVLTLLLPDKNKLATWTLVSYVGSLFVAMVILATLQIHDSTWLRAGGCVAVGELEKGSFVKWFKHFYQITFKSNDSNIFMK